MDKQYVEKRDRGYWIADSRVSLDSVILAFLDGLSPETIAAECFPVLSLEQVYGAVTFYLAHQVEIDAYLQQSELEYESLREATQAADPTFSEKLTKAYRQSQKFQP
jgi:uncharacterized protein (DUF433 family)